SKGEKKARALDKENRQHMLLRKILDMEDATILQLDIEQHVLVHLGLCIQRKHNVELGIRNRVGVHIDANIYAWRLFSGAERVRCTGAFERKVLEILRQNIKHGRFAVPYRGTRRPGFCFFILWTLVRGLFLSSHLPL